MLGRSVWHSPSANDSARIPWIMASPIRFQNLWVPTYKIFQDPRNSSISWRSASLWGLIEAQFKKPPPWWSHRLPRFLTTNPDKFGGVALKTVLKYCLKCWKTGLGNKTWRENGSKCNAQGRWLLKIGWKSSQNQEIVSLWCMHQAREKLQRRSPRALRQMSTARNHWLVGDS